MTALSDRIRAVVGTPTSAGFSPAAPAGLKACDLSGIGGEWRDGVYLVERRYDPAATHGRETVGAIAERLAASAEHACWFTGSCRRTGEPAEADGSASPPFAFFDLETTGLSGGAGTQAFLIGEASFDSDGSFRVQQWFLTSPADEKRILGAVQTSLGAAGALVSFNGKSFDAPVLETRYQFHRLSWDARRAPHIDVLHPARRFWGGATESDCSLTTLERQIIGARRVGDVSGFDIPARYFQYVRSGDARPLAPVFEHNRLDLLTLAALTSRLLHLARVGPSAARTAREALALGHVFSRVGMDAQAREAFERSLALCAAPSRAFDATRVAAMRALALAWRRARQFDRAAALWSELLQVRGCPAAMAREATEALAVHHEHRLRDLGAARAFALRGLDEDVTPEVPARSSWTRAVHHRLARIDRKLALSAPPSLLS